MPKNQNEWYVEFSNREIFDEKEIQSFDVIPFKNKVFFSHIKIESIQSLVYLSEFKNAKEVIDGKALYNISKYYFNSINWVLGKSPQASGFMKTKLILRKMKSKIL